MVEVLDVGSDRPPWSPRRRAVSGVLVAVVLAAGLGWALWPGGSDDADAPAPAPTSTPATQTSTRLPNIDQPDPTYLPLIRVPDGQPAALMIGRTTGNGAIERQDADAAANPWAVVVRRRDGSFGHHGAVITFPVSAPHPGRAVAVGGVTGTAAAHRVTWPLEGAYARIRGDLSEAELVAVARTVRVRGGHPWSDPPPGFQRVVVAQYEPTVIRETRFGDLAGPDYGLTFTGVLSATGFEDQVYALGGTPVGIVDGHPAIASVVGGGNGTLAWELAPGVVGFIGYSGSVPFGPLAFPRLLELAGDAGYLTGSSWRNLHPVTQVQPNAFGFDDFG